MQVLGCWLGRQYVCACSCRDNSKMILTASVRHSQSVTATPLKPWVAAEKCGNIVCAHCTCMAGLGEACSHIAALLFSAEAHTKYIKSIAIFVLPIHVRGFHQACRMLTMHQFLI